MTARTQAFTQSVFGFKSERNSSVDNLTSGSTFAGLPETFASNEVFVTVKADQAGTIFLDFSDNDGLTFETKSFFIAANVYREIHEFKAARRLRVRFTNTSASNQTSFSLNTYYGQFDSASGLIASSNPRDYFVELNKGNIIGQSPVAAIGEDSNVGTSFKVIWDDSSDMVFQTAVESLEILSSDANDTSAGTGVRTVSVTTLDSTYTEQTQTVTMNGTNVVALTGTHIAVQSVVGLTFGTAAQNGVAAGTVTLRVASAGNTRGVITAGNTAAMSSIYTVPLGKTALLTQIELFTPKNEDADVRTRFQIGDSGPHFIGATAGIYQVGDVFSFKVFLVLPEKSTFYSQAKSTSVGTRVASIAEFVLTDEDVTASSFNIF